MLEGLYESLVTRGLAAQLDELTDLTVDTGPLDDAEAPQVLARHIGHWSSRSFLQPRTQRNGLAS